MDFRDEHELLTYAKKMEGLRISDLGAIVGRMDLIHRKHTKGIVGPVPMSQAHPTVAELLRTTKPGVLHGPMLVGDWWIVLRLETYTPASFDEAMAERLSRELFDQWANGELARRMGPTYKPCVATISE